MKNVEDWLLPEGEQGKCKKALWWILDNIVHNLLDANKRDGGLKRQLLPAQ